MVEIICAKIHEPLIEAIMVVSLLFNLVAPMDDNPYAILVNEVFESEANEYIECITDIAMNESCKNEINIETCHSSSHIEGIS